ncbi:MAG: multidrug effflux MFS transporter [bacterium]|nr:multidrug effflux MFS transporter [bacterium]
MTSTSQSEVMKRLGRGHFTALLSMIMALAAVGIDLMLPAFDDIREHFGLEATSPQVAQIVTAFLLGMALSQFFYGPLADRFGRKPVLYGGFAIYIVGAIGAALAPSLELILLSRFIWGIGAAGPRVVSLSIVRDIYSGEEMAKAMSYILAIFIMVPVLAPSIGAGLIAVFSWRAAFFFAAVMAGVIAIWARVLPETLAEEDRRPINPQAIGESTLEVLRNRQTMGYTLARTATFGAFSSYLASSERIFGEFYGKPDQFPLIFGGIASTMGIAILVNASLVGRIGAKRTVHTFLLLYVAGSFAFWGVAAAAGGLPSFWVFVVGLGGLAGLHALLIPNFNTIAMWPMGHIAGTASAVTGTIPVAIGAIVGAVIDRLYTDTITPLVAAFAILGTLSFLFVLWAERGKLFDRPVVEPPPTVPPRPLVQ